MEESKKYRNKEEKNRKKLPEDLKQNKESKNHGLTANVVKSRNSERSTTPSTYIKRSFFNLHNKKHSSFNLRKMIKEAAGTQKKQHETIEDTDGKSITNIGRSFKDRRNMWKKF